MRDREDAVALELALIENMAREDLSPIEEARACAALVEELGLTREEVGLRVGRSRVAVSNLIRLLDLPDEAIELLEQGTLSEGHGRALLLAEDHGARRRLARSAAASGLVGAGDRRARAGEQRAGRRAPHGAIAGRGGRDGPPRPGAGGAGDRRGSRGGARRGGPGHAHARRRLPRRAVVRLAARRRSSSRPPAGPPRR